jgi:hypothetical protein
VPYSIQPSLKLEQYDQTNFGFLRFQVEKTRILGTYFSAPYSVGTQPKVQEVESFEVDLKTKTVQTLS